jgi:ketosteroid isomerase-like protein
MYKWLIAFFLVFSGGTLLADIKSSDEAIHNELRALLNDLEEAVNSKKYDQLPQYFHKNMTITMSNQEVLRSPEDIAKFFAFWFGKSGKLDHVEMKLTADALTQLYADKTIGLVYGSGVENTYLSDKRFFPMKTKWSATVIKDTDGKWRILSLHIGVNFLENPVMSMIEDNGKNLVLLGGAGGFLFGLLAGFMVWRRRKAE